MTIGQLAAFLAAALTENEREHAFTDFDRIEIATTRALVADLLSERHAVCADPWYTCAMASVALDGGECADDGRRGQPCDCGRDDRVQHRLRLLVQPYRERPAYLAEWTMDL